MILKRLHRRTGNSFFSEILSNRWLYILRNANVEAGRPLQVQGSSLYVQDAEAWTLYNREDLILQNCEHGPPCQFGFKWSFPCSV